MILQHFLSLFTKICLPFKLYYAKKHNLIFIKPDYWIVNKLNKKSIVIDIGLGNDADFSQELIKQFKLTSFGFDPTKKHQPGLNNIMTKLKPSFTYFPFALAHKSGVIKFFETQENISGSFSNKHVNILHDKIKSYNVKAITLRKAISLSKAKYIDLLKIDIEGEEYLVVKNLTSNDLKNIGQLIVEFHHQTIKDKTFTETQKLISHLLNIKYKRVFTSDNVNFLFYT